MLSETTSEALDSEQSLQGSFFSTLAFLYDPPRWVERVCEFLTLDGDELLRTITVTMRVPDTGYAISEDIGNLTTGQPIGFNFVALRPLKGTLVSVHEPESMIGGGVRRLGHFEHLDVSAMLIWSRFLSVCRDAIQEAEAAGQADWVKECIEVGTSLTMIPKLAAEDAMQLLSSRFGPSGEPLWLGERTSPFNATIRLYNLCRELADRYYVIFQFEATTGQRLQVRYGYRERWFDHSARWQDRAKEYLGAMPSAFRIHIPYSRLTDHYELQMEAPTGNYFYEQRLLKVKAVQARRAKSWRTFGEGRGNNEDVPSLEPVVTADGLGPRKAPTGPTVSREVGGGRTAHLFVGQGRSAGRTLYAGFRLFEIPPGTSGTSALALLLAAGLMCSLLWWVRTFAATPETLHSDLPVFLVGLATFAPTAVQSLLPRPEVVRAPLMSRVYLGGQAGFLILFAIWILSRSAGQDQRHSGYVRWWFDHGGTATTGALLLLTVHSLYRLWRGTLTYVRVIRSS